VRGYISELHTKPQSQWTRKAPLLRRRRQCMLLDGQTGIRTPTEYTEATEITWLVEELLPG